MQSDGFNDIVSCVVSISCREIEVITPDTKVVHSKSVAIFPFKPRDFVYLVHQRKLRDGTMVVLNR